MKNKSENVALIAIIVVIMAITAGVFGWMFAKKSQAPTEPVAQNHSATSLTQPVSDQQLAAHPIDETKDWPTYKNEEYGFEFKYPSNDWAVEAASPGDAGGDWWAISSKKDDVKFYIGIFKHNEGIFSGKDNKTSLEDLYVQLGGILVEKQAAERITLNNRQAYHVVDGLNNGENYLLANDNIIIYIDFNKSYVDFPDLYEITYDKILSTFKLTN